MIIVRLNGGLGNQLFQYAAGRSLAIKNNDILQLDVSGYRNQLSPKQIYRNLDITDFRITAREADSETISRIKNPLGSVSKILRGIEQKIFSRYYVDWHPEVLNQSGDTYLDGYFQTERYFQDHKEVILNELTLIPELAKETQSYLNNIESKNCKISLHIRRGDYVEDARTSKSHLVCNINYYKRAIAYMEERFPDLHLFIFSDDPQWVRENLMTAVPLTFVSTDKADRNALRPSQELKLMSKCSHHILSNSSFSWWGAYLNRSTDKVVLAPNVWNKGPIPQPNILPMGWIPFQVL